MDFHLDDDQLALQDHVQGYCRARWPLERVGERPSGGLDRDRWGELQALGAVSLLAEEAKGGLGLGAVEAAVVFEQLGSHLVPGPCLWSAVGALVAPDVARGQRVAGGAVDVGAGRLFVEHASDVDTLLVVRPTCVSRIDRAELPAPAPANELDPLTPIGVFSSLPEGARVGDAADATRMRRLGTLLASALQLGIAQAALDVSVRHALQREQFGVPIGSFQALKHMMADMYVRVGLARSATYAAAAVLDDPAVGDALRSLGAAKLLAGEAAVDNARAAVQVLGGMGFTWSMPPHFLLKRALVLDQAFGTPASHALAIAGSLAQEAA